MGDLADILRATGGNMAAEEWHFQSNTIACDPVDEFGNPFTHLRDPLIDNTPVSNEFTFHNSSTNVVEGCFGNSGKIANGSYHRDHEMKRPNIFSRMLQISPDPKLQVPRQNSPAALATAAVAVAVAVAASPKVLNNNDLIYPNRCNGVQISSPRNTGIKRRKSQAKKVVCIPAPAPANSRPSSGEIVPSDLWAWRKYGQKPIKGSPYPRGYYRCSSSKGCPARKQVERSRTDPNMLVITYTSEHNHPWPTQRNALAGSTRSQQAATKNTSTTSKSAPIFQAQNSSNPKHNEKKELGANSLVKEEKDDDPDFDDGCNPEFPDGSNQPEDSFFADLGEIEPNPLDLIFGQEFCGGRENTGFDSVGYDYWAGCNGGATTSAHSATSFYGEAKRDS